MSIALYLWVSAETHLAKHVIFSNWLDSLNSELLRIDWKSRHSDSSSRHPSSQSEWDQPRFL